MKSSIRLGSAACLVALLALLAAWKGFSNARSARQGRAAIARDHAALEVSLQQAREQASAQLRDAAALQAALAAAPSSAPAAGGAPARPPGGPSLASLLAANPKLMDLYLKSFRAGLPDRYGFAYVKLGLSQALIDKFEEITTAQEGDRMDLQGAAEAQGLPNDDPGIAAMRRQSQKQYQQAILALVTQAGVATVAQVTELRGLAAEPLQNLVGSLASMMTVSSAPLTYAQAGQLAPILAAANTTPGQSVNRTAIDWDKATTQAAGILSAQQLQALQTLGYVTKVTNLAKAFDAQEHPNAGP